MTLTLSTDKSSSQLPWWRRVARGIRLAAWAAAGLGVAAPVMLVVMLGPHYALWGALLPLGLALFSWHLRGDSPILAVAWGGTSALTTATWLDFVLGGPVLIGF